MFKYYWVAQLLLCQQAQTFDEPRLLLFWPGLWRQLCMADKETLSHHLVCRPDMLLDAVAPFLLTLWRLADPCCCFVYILPGDVTEMQKLYCWETPNTLQAVQDSQDVHAASWNPLSPATQLVVELFWPQTCCAGVGWVAQSRLVTHPAEIVGARAYSTVVNALGAKEGVTGNPRWAQWTTCSAAWSTFTCTALGWLMYWDKYVSHCCIWSRFT